MGLIPSVADLSLAEKVTASCFCRRRLSVVMAKSKFSLFYKLHILPAVTSKILGISFDIFWPVVVQSVFQVAW